MGLYQGQCLKKFIQRSKTPGQTYVPHCIFYKHHLSAEEIPEVHVYVKVFVWFLFKNLVVHGEVEFDIKDILGGDDPHPRLCKREIEFQGTKTSPVKWPHEAHKFPAMISDKQIFSETFVTHRRELANIVRTHLHRGKTIP